MFIGKGDVRNEDIDIRLSVSGHTDAQNDSLTQHHCLDDLKMYEEVISHEEMGIDGLMNSNSQCSL